MIQDLSQRADEEHASSVSSYSMMVTVASMKSPPSIVLVAVVDFALQAVMVSQAVVKVSVE